MITSYPIPFVSPVVIAIIGFINLQFTILSPQGARLFHNSQLTIMHFFVFEFGGVIRALLLVGVTQRHDA